MSEDARSMTPNLPGRSRLQMLGVSKSFPGVQALDDVSIAVDSGEVLALLGENGAGKSTLIRILGGALFPDAGDVSIDGKLQTLNSPVEARDAGISIIYQEFNLVPALTVRENIFLGRESRLFSFIRGREEARRTRELLERLGSSVDPETRCEQLTVAEQQIVEIARALAFESRIIVMDEPSAALSPREVQGLFRIIEELKKDGLALIYISHRLDEIEQIADRVTVLRDGRVVGTDLVTKIPRARMIEMMVGRNLDGEFPAAKDRQLRPGLEVRHLVRSGAVHDVSFEVKRGEIVGLTGLVGSGRSETARLMFAADQRDSGTILLDGKPLQISSPRDAINAGICLLTEDRKQQGLILQHSLIDNFSLPSLARFSHAGFLDRSRIHAEFARFRDRLRIRSHQVRQPALTLSGGNQQKLVLAKWLARQSEVLVFDEPTRGIDVGARFEIYQLMQDLAAEGKAILMISSELPEIIGMADRILVMRQGRLTGELPGRGATTQREIMELAVDVGDMVNENPELKPDRAAVEPVVQPEPE